VDEMYAPIWLLGSYPAYSNFFIVSGVFVGHLTFFQLTTEVETRTKAPFDFKYYNIQYSFFYCYVMCIG
jgi:hypothetical protein